MTVNDHLDLFSEQFQQRPFPALASLRAEAPVCRVVNGWYLVTTLDLARRTAYLGGGSDD
ncbi:MAG TPA: hypothetical protein VFU35_01875 [Jatrophihabitans sp.]|nr:hypothetical protein [Jatrophihabitans sp.]